MSLQPNLDEPLSGGLFHAPDPGQDDRQISRRLDRGVGAHRQGGRARPTPTSRPITRSWSIRRSLAGRYYKKWALSPRVNLERLRRQPRPSSPRNARADRRAQAAGRPGGEDCSARSITTITNSCSRSPTSSAGSGSSITAVRRTASRPGYFTDWDEQRRARATCCRTNTRIAGTASSAAAPTCGRPIIATPMRDQLLWVYEGQTQFWGYVLQARSGLVIEAGHARRLCRDRRATSTTRRARNWRALVDTTNDPIISQRASPRAGPSWQRRRGLLQRRPADLDGGRFDPPRAVEAAPSRSTISPRAFFGINDGDWGEVTYTFDDVVATLNAIQPYDWARLPDASA